MKLTLTACTAIMVLILCSVRLIPHVLRVRRGAEEGCRAKESKEQGYLNRPLELAYSKPSHIVGHLGSCAILRVLPFYLIPS